jgi:hypothetical protein
MESKSAMTAPDYSDDEIRNLVLRVLADQQSVPAPTPRPKQEVAGSGVGRELSFDEILKKIQDGI